MAKTGGWCDAQFDACRSSGDDRGLGQRKLSRARPAEAIAGSASGSYRGVTEAVLASERPRIRRASFRVSLSKDEDSTQAKEIAKWNAEVDAKKAAKKAAKKLRNEGKARRKHSF